MADAYNVGSSISEGFKTGTDWAKAKQLNDYRNAELQKQYMQLKEQKAAREMKVMEKMSDYMWTVATVPPKQRSKYFQVVEKQAEMMHIDVSGWKPLINDPSFVVDVAGPLKQIVDGLKSGDSGQISQAFPRFMAGIHDPVAARQMLTEITRASGRQGEAQSRAGNKEADTLTKYQNMLNKDKNYQTINGVLQQTESSKELINSATDNPVANNLLPINLVRAVLGNSSRVNIQELKSAKGSQALTDRAAQIGKQMAQGTLTDDNKKWMLDLVGKLEKGANQSKLIIEKNYSKQFSQRTGLPIDESYEKLTGSIMPEEKAAKAEKTTGISSDQLKAISDRIPNLRKQGISDQQLHDELSATLSPEQLKTLGLKATAPAPIAAPPATQAPTMDMSAPQEEAPPPEEPAAPEENMDEENQ